MVKTHNHLGCCHSEAKILHSEKRFTLRWNENLTKCWDNSRIRQYPFDSQELAQGENLFGGVNQQERP